jgi:hypothetical protein
MTGKGPLLARPVLPPSPGALPLTVQLHAGGAACWEARFGTTKKNDERQLKAISD